jgi:hypothetical protein
MLIGWYVCIFYTDLRLYVITSVTNLVTHSVDKRVDTFMNDCRHERCRWKCSEQLHSRLYPNINVRLSSGKYVSKPCIKWLSMISGNISPKCDYIKFANTNINKFLIRMKIVLYLYVSVNIQDSFAPSFRSTTYKTTNWLSLYTHTLDACTSLPHRLKKDEQCIDSPFRC